MKEAFWGVLIIILGLFGVVVVNLFQNVTVDNDRVYYLIKESTEASALDALDLTYYRLNGDIRIVQDKFVENLARRFSENVTIGDYRIVVEDLNEVPPKISLRIRSGVTSLMGESFGIVNRVDAVIEAKYSLDEVLDFLGITEEEWLSHRNKPVISVDSSTGKSTCNVAELGDIDLQCMPGDIKFTGFSDVNMKSSICRLETPARNVGRTAKYKTCDCGKWSEEKTETVYANPVLNGNKYVYTWFFNKSGEIRKISEKAVKERVIGKCIEGITLRVPKDLVRSKKYTGADGSTPHSTSYINCPSGGITILKGAKLVLQPLYKPTDTTERNAKWSVADSNILQLDSNSNSSGFTTVSSTCKLNKNNTNCLAKTTITAKAAGVTTITSESERGHKSTCKVTVWDGNPNSVGCKNLTVMQGAPKTLEVTYNPTDTVNKKVTYSISDSSIASIDANGKIIYKKEGTATITVTSANGKTGTCKLTTDDGKVSKIGCSANKKEIDYNGTAQFTANITPSNATYKNITWKVNNSKASINSSGKLIGVNSGTGAITVTVTVTDTISGKSGTCTIKVKGKPASSSGGSYSGTVSSGDCSCTHVYELERYLDPITGEQKTLKHTHTCGGSIEEECDDKTRKIISKCITKDGAFCTYKTNGNSCTPKCASGYYLSSNGCVKCSGGGYFTNETLCETQNAGYYGRYACSKVATGCYKRGELICKSGTYKKGDSCIKCPYGSLASCRSMSNGVAGCKQIQSGCWARTGYIYCYYGYRRCGSRCCKNPSGGSSGGGGGGCFLAGTKITTKDGYKNIEDIEVGDIVLSYNEEKNITEYNKVYGLYSKYDTEEELYELTINGKVIKVTQAHAFYINRTLSRNNIYVPNVENNNEYYKLGEGYAYPSTNGSYWVPTPYLKIGDMVMTSDGNYYPITNIIHYPHEDMIYNFGVENNFNYYVYEDQILVHNRVVKQ